MAWARFDDHRHASGKLIAAGLEANGLDANAITWCSANLTDGFVPDPVLPVIAAGSIAPPAELAARLVAVGRWERDDGSGGWWVHDFLDFNPTRDEVMAKREKRRAAGSKGGKASAEARRGAAGQANGQANASTACEPRPVPSRPVTPALTVDSSLTSSSSEGVQGDDDDRGEHPTITAALDIASRRALQLRNAEAKHRKPVPPGTRSARWRAEDTSTRRTDSARLLAAGVAYDPAITPDDLARTVWPELWSDERAMLRAVPDG